MDSACCCGWAKLLEQWGDSEPQEDHSPLSVNVSLLSGQELCKLVVDRTCTVELLKHRIQSETDIPQTRQHLLHAQSTAPLPETASLELLAEDPRCGWVGGWVDGWMDGWMHACMRILAVCECILERHDFREADAHDQSGLTALHCAASRGHLGAALVLVGSGAFTVVNSAYAQIDRNGGPVSISVARCNDNNCRRTEPQQEAVVENPCQVPEDDQKKRTAAEHSEKSCKRIGPQQEAVLEDPCQKKVPEDDQKKRTTAEHSEKSCKRIGPQQDARGPLPGEGAGGRPPGVSKAELARSLAELVLSSAEV
eukprot:s3896_g5.t1